MDYFWKPFEEELYEPNKNRFVLGNLFSRVMTLVTCVSRPVITPVHPLIQLTGFLMRPLSGGSDRLHDLERNRMDEDD